MNVEIEFKTQINKEKYDELIQAFDLENNVFKQTNYYFDTKDLELNHKSMVLRIRQKRENSFKLT
ncbi:CYTH domain-containing protein [Acholeplasma equirhinis]|nr:CYTH domain-containing protein [Acholeplasma equirhinis]